MKIQSYEEVLAHLKKEKREKHLLLGNGFSMSYDPGIFSYNALSRFVESSSNDLLKKIFEIVNNRNFEQIMQQLGISKSIIQSFGGDEDVIGKIDSASTALKRSLIEAVKEFHPEHVFMVPEHKSKNCASFLSEYLNNGGKIFSTNYDILLYWVLMRNAIPNSIDGFGRDRETEDEFVPAEEAEYSELRWGNNRNKQNIFYLHGALHIFDDGLEIVKEEYDASGYILEKVERRMANSQYPIFVTAGNGAEKLNHILHNHYLASCYDELSSISGSLITFGFNFGEYDDHIIKAINDAAKQDIETKLWSVYIGVYSEDDIKHIQSIESKFKCKVNVFDTKTVKVW